MTTKKPKTSAGDDAVIQSAATGQGAVELTPDLMAQLGDSIAARHADIAKRYPALVAACPEEMKLAVTAWVMNAIVKHATEGGTFRYLIYDRLGFDTDAYVPLYEAGGMTISNEFVLGEADPAGDSKLADELRQALWPHDHRTIQMEGGKEPWFTVCRVADRLSELSALLAAEQEKRLRVDLELADLKDHGVVIPKGDE